MPTYMGAHSRQKSDFRFSGDGATARWQAPEMGAENRTLVFCRSSIYFNNRVIAPEAAYFFEFQSFILVMNTLSLEIRLGLCSMV